MKKSYLWRKMTSGLMAAAVTVTAMPGLGLTMVQAEEKKTGCLVCLDSCPVGIVSNATYTYGAVEKRGEVKFKGNASVLPADNTLATVTFKIT